MNYFLIFSVAVLFAATACERVQEGEVRTDQPVLNQEVQGEAAALGAPMPAPSLNVANVVLQPQAGKAVTFAIEIADTPEARRQGLMGRENLGDKQGMWFVFDQDVRDPFWMKDTPVSLDIIFVDKDYKIVDIIASTVPNSETLLVPKQSYRYVLETNAGTATTHK
ncbi:MAG: DUF192 domain-containing protein, partial [bacterium]|nr:DUF192 domain-containing protein [bacterium]